MRPETINWMEGAEYDLESARSMLSTRRYLYVIFFCHLTVEKILKALVSEMTGKTPPKTHDLIYLIRKTGISLEEEQHKFISELNRVSVPTRYPDDIRKLLLEYNKEVADFYLQNTEDLIQWLKSQQKLNK